MALRLRKPKAKDATTLFREWLADCFIIPSGISRGQSFELHDFQLDFLAQYLAREDGSPKYRTCIFSLPRKMRKSTSVSALLLGRCLADSPIFIPRFKALCVAPTAKLAGLIPAAAIEIMQAAGRDSEIALRSAPSPGRLVIGDGQCQLLSGDSKSGHGDDVDLAILDEAGLVPRRQDEIFDATFNALAARDGQQILTGTRLDNEKFSDMIESPPPSTYVALHAADKDCDPGDPVQWEQATPGGFRIKSKAFLRDAFEKVKASGSLVDFQTSHLNLPGNPARELLISPDVLKAAYRDDAKPIEGEPCFVGLDLGGSTSMSAATVVYESGLIRSIGAFPGEGMSLKERGERDFVGNLYERLAQSGELLETSGRVADMTKCWPVSWN